MYLQEKRSFYSDDIVSLLTGWQAAMHKASWLMKIY